VNRTDCGFIAADPFIIRLFAGLLKPKYPILGCEYSGEVVEVGPDITQYKIGDRVFGFCDDDFGFGGHGEYTCVPERSLMARIPNNVSFQTAAVALEGGHYALHGIIAADIGPSHKVLVNGATGAIGSATVQILRAKGVDITAVCATPHMDTVKALGAGRVIDYLTEDFTELDEKFDCVLDTVGKSSFPRCRKILTENGIYISTELGTWLSNPLQSLIPKAIRKQQVMFPIPKIDVAHAHYLRDLMHSGDYQPMIDREYSINEIADAYRYVLTGEKIGNVLIRVVDK